jgi:hypothetical protein
MIAGCRNAVSDYVHTSRCSVASPRCNIILRIVLRGTHHVLLTCSYHACMAHVVQLDLRCLHRVSTLVAALGLLLTHVLRIGGSTHMFSMLLCDYIT